MSCAVRHATALSTDHKAARTSSWHCTSVDETLASKSKTVPSACCSIANCVSVFSMASLASTSSVEPCTSDGVDGSLSRRTQLAMTLRCTKSLRVFSTSASAPIRLITSILFTIGASRLRCASERYAPRRSPRRTDHLTNSSTAMSTSLAARMLRGLRRTSMCSVVSTWLTISTCVSNS